MSDKKEPEWRRWNVNQSLIRIVGHTLQGDVVYEWGRDHIDRDTSEIINTESTPVPECTGWDWVPPVESPEDWVTQDRVPDRPGIDWYRWSTTSSWRVLASSDLKYFKHGARHGELTFEVRCRRKDLPPLPGTRKRVYLHEDQAGQLYITHVRHAFDKEIKHDADGFYVEE